MKAIVDLYNDKKELIASYCVDGRTAAHHFRDYMKWNYSGSWAVGYVKLRGQILRILNQSE